MITRFRRVIATLVVTCVAGIGAPLPSHAAMIATPDAVSPERARVLQLLDRAEVQHQLQAHGVNPIDAKARVAVLGDDEARQLAAQIDGLPAGGDALGALISAVLIVFLVLLITDILGFTKVFPFTKPVK